MSKTRPQERLRVLKVWLEDLKKKTKPKKVKYSVEEEE
jgi:hypothetical protein